MTLAYAFALKICEQSRDIFNSVLTELKIGPPTMVLNFLSRKLSAFISVNFERFTTILFFIFMDLLYPLLKMGWSGGAMVLGKLPVPGRPTILITVGQGPIAPAVGAGGGGLDIFTLIYPFSSFSLSLGDGSI